MEKARVTYYKEKGAHEEYYRRRKGLDKVEDITLNLFSRRRYSVIDLERKLTTNLSIMSKFLLILK